MNISITNKDGLVLETAHEICEENIIIEPVLQDINITRNGKYLPGDGYAGFRRAFIEIPDSAIPTEVATEEEMTAILSSGDVGGVYKYVGETGEVYANGEMYVLEALPDELAGTWVFNDTVEFPSGGFPSTTDIVEFVSSNKSYNNILIQALYPRMTYRNLDDSSNDILVYDSGVWTSDEYKTINITSNLADVTGGDTLLAWLQANATKQ